MPKAISNDERETTKNAFRQASITLIKNKGLRRLTVDDLTKSVGIAKGSFYFYFQSKEELLYETISQSERKTFETMMNLSYSAENFRENVERMLFDVYLAPDSIALYLKSEDMHYLMRKLPAKTREQEKLKSHNNLAQVGELFGLSEEDGGTLAYLTDSLRELATSEQDYGNKSRQQGLKILVRGIADFLNEKSTTRGKG
ncbi:MAG: TetR/AcrR family transcriptional regulator [Defluviitaleaceae bacterium]|nr:TetR/AcrR family transcriptional regulator [Defluviitaleaceae bacterium]MCL2247588.1 TetR/AcrR family transcriptional regulator [Lentimicrobiaceae bacterium]